MKVNTKALVAALADVSRAIKTRTTLPILTHVHLSRVGDELQIIGSDLDNTITRRIECADGGIEPVCVAHRLLSRLVSVGDSDSVVLGNDKAKLLVQTKSKSTIQTMPAADFPPLPNEKEIELAILAEDLADGLEAVHWAAESNGALGSPMGNIFVEASATLLACVAMDGRRMAYFNRPLICEGRDLLLPLMVVPHLIPELREKNASVFASERAITVRHNRGSIRAKLAEGGFPNYKRFTEARKGLESTVVSGEFLRRACASAIALQATDKTPCIELESDGVTLEVFSDAALGEYRDTSPCVGTSDVLTSLNAVYVEQSLKALAGEKINILKTDSATYFESGDLLVAIAELIPPGSRADGRQREKQAATPAP